VDVDEDKAAEAYVKELNDNMRIVPTIVFPDGTILVEPDDQTLREKLKSL
jgi:mycoredoxin